MMISTPSSAKGPTRLAKYASLTTFLEWIWLQKCESMDDSIVPRAAPCTVGDCFILSGSDEGLMIF